MTKEQPHKRKIWIRWLFRIFAGLLLLAVIAVVIVLFWIIPAIVRSEITRKLSAFCDGSVKIDNIEVNYFEPLYVSNISFSNSAGQECLHIRSAELILENWPSPSPKLTSIEVDGLNYNILVTGGKYAFPPVRLLPQASRSTSRFNLQRLSVKNISIELVDADNQETIYNNLTLLVKKQNDFFDFLLSSAPSDESELLAAQGSINPKTSEINLSLQLKHKARRAETSAICKGLGISKYAGEGNVAADLIITANLREQLNFQPDGSIELKGWTIFEEGQVSIKQLSTDIKLDGPNIQLANFTLSDANNFKWLEAKTSNLTLRDWPGLLPALTEIEIEGLKLHSYLTNGKFSIPIKLPTNITQESEKRRFDLEKLVLKDSTIDIKRKKSTTAFTNLHFEAERQQDNYNILLTRNVPEEASEIFIKGTINPVTSDIELFLQMEHSVKKREAAIVFAALKEPRFLAEGRLSADLTVTGCLREPHQLKPQGDVALREWTMLMDEKVIAENLATNVRVENKRLDFENFTATVCKGQVNGSFYTQIDSNQPIDFNGQISAQKVSLPEITSLVAGPDEKASKGTITLKCNFLIRGIDPNTLKSEGLLFFDDADMTILPVIPHLFTFIGLADYNPLKMSDAEITFTMAGPVMTIKRAHIANPFAAIEAEPGGTINLKTKQVNAHVVAIPLRQIDNILKQIPVVNIIVNLKDKLTRLRVKGRWTDPPAKLITKQPIEDIKDGTFGFLKDVTNTGGQFSQEMLKGFGILFPTKDKNKQ